MTPNLRYINQSAPFWDWIASFEQQAQDHPFFNGQGPSHGPPHHPHHHHPHGPPPHHEPHHAPGDDKSPPPSGPPPHYPGVTAWAAPWASWAGPWSRGFGGWQQGSSELPHRGGPPPHYHDHHHQHAGANASGEEQSADEKVADGEVEGETSKEALDKGAVPDPPEEAPHGLSDRDARRWGRAVRKCERRDRRYGPASRGHHGPHGGRGGWGGPGRGGFGMLRDLFGPGGPEQGADGSDWKPEADVFDTEGSYVVHISLPGAHKEDIGVTWDAEKSELAVAGVVHRPGDEAFIKTLALDERKTGAFERKVRLGTRAVPAHVDVEGISAKLENGILIVEVPKLNGEFVEVKKVDIE